MMPKHTRVSLVDPMLYDSSYVNKNPLPSITTTFRKKFNLFNFVLNILLPCVIIVFVLFVLKDRYVTKKNKLSLTSNFL